MKALQNKFILSILSGILLALAWPCIGSMAPLIFIAFIPLLYAEEKVSSFWGAFSISYVAFFVWNLLTVWWLYYASLPGLLLALFCNSLFMALVFASFHFAKKALGFSPGIIAFVFFWIGFEYLHFNWDLSFPWLTLGNAFANFPSLIQWYEYTGVLGGSLWALIINAIIFSALKFYSTGDKRRSVIWTTIAALIIIIPIVISFTLNKIPEGTTQEVVIVQPNIDPYNEKFNGLSSMEQVDKMLALAESKMTEKTAAVIFPETAIPRNVWEDRLNESEEISAFTAFKQKHPNANIIAGISSSRAYLPPEKPSHTARKFIDVDLYYDHFNSGLFISEGGYDIYHKSKLVIGVEFMPYTSVFKHFEELAVDLGGTVGSLGTQEERSVFKSEKGNWAPVICYESVYADYCTDYVKNGAQAIAIITNDGWWDDTPGYKQHLLYGALRAIENRKYIARSANTGTSAIITPTGEILSPTQWWKEDAISGEIVLNDVITFYAKTGDYIGRIMAFFSVLLLALAFVRLKSKKELF